MDEQLFWQASPHEPLQTPAQAVPQPLLQVSPQEPWQMPEQSALQALPHDLLQTPAQSLPHPLLHDVEQSEQELDLEDPVHELQHPDAHSAVQSEQAVSCFLQPVSIWNVLEPTIIPRIGKVLKVACLKNSRRL